jgi:arginine decarboxylase
MKNTYFNLIEQTYYFPQEGFDLRDDYLTFHGISLKYLIEKYGTPFRFIYLPKIGDQIKKARNLFNRAIKRNGYNGTYQYCYCTKCNHFSHVVHEAVKHSVNIETSSAFDIDLVVNLEREGRINKECIVVNNGYKTDSYLRKIIALHDLGFSNIIVILDSRMELDRLLTHAGDRTIKIGLRMAINQEPQDSYYTSRLGIPADEIVDFYRDNVAGKANIEMKMLHFFVDSGIRDNLYYWGEFQRALKLYVDLKSVCHSLDSLNLGGGFPIRNGLGFEYDYDYMVNEIVKNIKEACIAENVPDPDIYTEFGKYTVGESGAIIFKVLEQKQQNDKENWYIIDNSLMNTIPDAWSLHEKFILLPINKWDRPYVRAHIGGISCDHYDYYNSDDFNQEVLLPQHNNNDSEALYLGFFHTGAYQDAISGYGGIKHCLIPSPKHVIIDRDARGNIIDYVYRNEQSAEEMFRLLGYEDKYTTEPDTGSVAVAENIPKT